MNEPYGTASRLKEIQQRVRRCCCKHCGGKLSLHRIIFSDLDEARLEIYCERCQQIEFGVEPEIYRSAANFVDGLDFNYYSELDDTNRTRQMNIAKVCEIMAWGYRSIGLLDQDGFTVPLAMAGQSADGCLLISETELAAQKECSS